MSDKVGSTSVYPHWIEEQDRFWYSYETPEGKNWFMVDAQEGTKRTLFDRQKMAAQLSETFNKPFNSKNLDLKEFEFDTKKGLFTFHVDSINFEYDLEEDNLIRKDSLEENGNEHWKTYSPDSTWIAFAKNHNLYLMQADDPDSTEYQLTEDGERWYSYQADQSDTTSNERLRSRARWFEDSRKLYLKRQDARKVKPLWVIHSLDEPRPSLETYKYAMPGDDHIPLDEVWVFKADTLSSTQGVKMDIARADAGNNGSYLIHNLVTSTGSQYLWILRRAREWNEIDVFKANTRTGEAELLFSEEDNPYFNPRFVQLASIHNGEEYLWWSERTGWGQLYRYDSEGNLKNRITEGYYTVGDIVKIDTTEKTIYFDGYNREEGISPYHSQLYKISFDGSGMERLTPQPANHEISASDEGNYFVDNYSRPDKPTTTVLRDGEGNVIQHLEQTNVEPLKEIGWEPPTPVKVKAADGVTDLYGVMWKPFDFDSTKTYPVISYVYPGPQVEPFPTQFQFTHNTALAQVGFIVVALGQRGGSPLRSKYYHTYGYGNLRDYPLIDNKHAIKELGSRYSFIDLDRVGIWGHSGGGFMSTAEILTYPDFYSVAWSESGNHDNNIYNLWWSESHNGVEKVSKTIQVDNGNGGKKDSTVTKWKAPVDTNIELADNLEGHLMLVTGTADANVNPANTIRLANALIEADKRFDYMILPDKRHGYGDFTPYVEHRRWEYFARHLLDWQPDGVDIEIPDTEKGDS